MTCVRLALWAAGAVLKLTVASVFTFAGVKPNFMIHGALLRPVCQHYSTVASSGATARNSRFISTLVPMPATDPELVYCHIATSNQL